VDRRPGSARLTAFRHAPPRDEAVDSGVLTGFNLPFVTQSCFDIGLGVRTRVTVEEDGWRYDALDYTILQVGNRTPMNLVRKGYGKAPE
jgi:hypothetical protein